MTNNNEYTIICSRTPRQPAFRSGDVVIRCHETDMARTGVFSHYSLEAGLAVVQWTGNAHTSQVQTTSIMHVELWNEARKQQAALANYWQITPNEKGDR